MEVSGLLAGERIAAATPGLALLIAAADERGLASFDLGVGHSRYKGEICEIAEPLSDTAVGVTWRGGAEAGRARA